MNYIRELNAFYDWLERNPLTPAAITLWYSLMHINNRTGWRNNIAVTRSEIKKKSGLGKSAYYAARELLMKRGLVTFTERGTKATIFEIIPFYESEFDARETKVNVAENRWKGKRNLSDKRIKMDIHMSENQPSENESLSENQPSSAAELSDYRPSRQENLSENRTIPKHIKTKQKKTKQHRIEFYTKVMECYKQHFGKLNPFLMEELMQWVDDVGEEMVMEAMELAIEGNQSWKQAKTYLQMSVDTV